MNFLKHWFSGFEKGMTELPEEAQNCLLGACAKACSQSYSLQVYKEIRDKSKDVCEFFDNLREAIPAIDILEIHAGIHYAVCYHKCLCDLFTEGWMKEGVLCECSRQSLLYNLRQVFPEKDIQVQLEQSILRGDKGCRLDVIISE